MRVAVVRIAGTQFNPAEYARQSGFTPDIMWRSGETDLMGRIHRESGFSLTIADADSASELVRQIHDWVESHRSALEALSASGGTAVIDVGLTVGTPAQFTAGVVFASSDLRLLAEAGVELSVSAYPASEDA